jgi:hypothetical protein
VFSNSLGVYSIDKESGAIKNIEFDSAQYNSIKTFFEIEGVLYFYRAGADMFMMKDGKAVKIASSVAEHYVKDGNIYLIKNREPRIEVITSTGKESYSIGDSQGIHDAGGFIESNGDLIGFINLMYTGTNVIFKMTDDGPEYIIAPGLPGYTPVKEALFLRIRDVQGEIWANGFYGGNYRFVDGNLLPWDNQFSFALSVVRDFYDDDGMLYVLTNNHFIKTDLTTKEETILHTISDEILSQAYFFKGNQVYYLVVNNAIYTYDPEKDLFEEQQVLINKDIRIVKENEKNELIVVKIDRIEWYNNPEPAIYESNGPSSNLFVDIDYDTKNNKLVALGQVGLKFVIQEYDGVNWNSFDVPYSLTYEYQYPDAGLYVDNEGNYLLSLNDNLWKWDGTKWERISFIEFIPDILQEERYKVYCRDSTGALWVGASISKFSQEENKNILTHEFWKYYDGEFHVIIQNIPEYTTGPDKRGICMRDGTIRIDLSSQYIYDINEETLSTILVSDGKDAPFTNKRRYLSVNKNNDLILNFQQVSGWTINHGSYSFDAGHSVYNAGKWEHLKYNNILLGADLQIISSFITFDTYENDWIISSQYFLKITDDDDVQIFYPTLDLVQFTPFLDNYVQIGNKIWFASRFSGIFEMDLPKATSVDSKNVAEQTQYILNPIVHDTHIELSEQIDWHEIYTIKGERLLTGQHDQFIDVQHISNGAYFMVGKANNKIFVNKFLISR